MDFDLVVVGAGPAGSAVARATARAGVRVLLVEEHREVGSPLQCSGFVTPRTLELADVPSEGLVWNRVKGALVRGPGGTTVVLGGGRVRALALDREALDQRLAQAATQAGATLHLETRLVNIERRNGHLELGLWRGPRREPMTVRTPLLVGADGWNSTVARWMGQPQGPMIRCATVDTYLPDLPRDMAQVLVGQDLAPGWFAWTIPLREGVVRVGIGCDPAQSASPPRALLMRLLVSLNGKGKTPRPLKWAGGVIPLYHTNGNPPPPTCTHNVMLVGDAARQVKPTSGGGIYPGLVAAQWASRVAVQALEEGNVSAQRLAAYEQGWRRELGAEFHREQDLRRLFLQLRDRDMERLLGLLRLPGAQYLIRRYGDIDFQTPLFARLLQVMPILWKVVPLASRLIGPWGRTGPPGQGIHGAPAAPVVRGDGPGGDEGAWGGRS